MLKKIGKLEMELKEKSDVIAELITVGENVFLFLRFLNSAIKKVIPQILYFRKKKHINWVLI